MENEKKELEEQKKIFETKEKIMEEEKKELEEEKKELEEGKKFLEIQKNEIEQQMKEMDEYNKILEEKEKNMERKEKEDSLSREESVELEEILGSEEIKIGNEEVLDLKEGKLKGKKEKKLVSGVYDVCEIGKNRKNAKILSLICKELPKKHFAYLHEHRMELFSHIKQEDKRISDLIFERMFECFAEIVKHEKTSENFVNFATTCIHWTKLRLQMKEYFRHPSLPLILNFAESNLKMAAKFCEEKEEEREIEMRWEKVREFRSIIESHQREKENIKKGMEEPSMKNYVEALFLSKKLKVAVTNSNFPIGRELVENLISIGFSVCVNSCSEKEILDFPLNSENFFNIHNTLHTEEHCKSFAKSCVEKMEGIDVLICCIFPQEDQTKNSEETQKKFLDSNWRARNVLITNSCVPFFSKSKDASVLLFSGLNAIASSSQQRSALALSDFKSSLENLCKFAALELQQKKVRVNCLQVSLSPSSSLFSYTEINLASIWNSLFSFFENNHNNSDTPKQAREDSKRRVIELILFLISNKSGSLTGNVISLLL